MISGFYAGVTFLLDGSTPTSAIPAWETETKTLAHLLL